MRIKNRLLTIALSGTLALSSFAAGPVAAYAAPQAQTASENAVKPERMVGESPSHPHSHSHFRCACMLFLFSYILLSARLKTLTAPPSLLLSYMA